VGSRFKGEGFKKGVGTRNPELETKKMLAGEREIG
jgi:hypothetical protein